MAATSWVFWAGAGLALLVVVGVLLRRPAGGWAACAASLAALAALGGPSFIHVEKKAWEVLDLREGPEGGEVPAGRNGFPGGPVAETLRFRLGEERILPPGAGPGRPGLPSWTSLAALFSLFCPADREGALLLDLSSCPEGLDGPDLPEGTPSWAGLAGLEKGGKKGPSQPGLAAWVPRAPRAGRPWFFLVRTGPWKPGASLGLEISPLEGGKSGKRAFRADPRGIALARVEGPILKKGRRLLLLRCRGDGGEARALLSLEVGPAPAVALPRVDGLLSSLLRAQGFRVFSWKGPGEPPKEAEVLAWDQPGAAELEGKGLLSFLDRGGGLLSVGKGLLALSSLEGVSSRLPLRPLPEKPPKEEGKKKTVDLMW